MPSGAPRPAGHLPLPAGLPHATPRPCPRHVPSPRHVPGRHPTAAARACHSPRGGPGLPEPSGRLGALGEETAVRHRTGPTAAQAATAASGKVGGSEGGRVGGAEGRGPESPRAGREPGVAKEEVGREGRKGEGGPGEQAG